MTNLTDHTLYQLESCARELLALTETTDGLNQLEQDGARWFGVFLALSLVGARLSKHMGRDFTKRLRLVGGAQ
jgi:hypothetical protein